VVKLVRERRERNKGVLILENILDALDALDK
jgi:hypothetical protein